MQGFTLFFPALASFLLHVDAGPLAMRDNATNIVRTLTRPFSSTNLLIATYLFRRQFPSGQKCLHADILCGHHRGRVRYGGCLPKQDNEWEPGKLWQRVFLHQVGTWFWERNPTSDVSRLPSSLLPLGEEALTYEKHCPAIIPDCKDPSCLGAPGQGCSQQAGVQFRGCNCTGATSTFYENLEQEEDEEDDPIAPKPVKPICPSSIFCSDPKCDGTDTGSEGKCNSMALVACSCLPGNTTCPSSISCSDPKCQGTDTVDGKGMCTLGVVGACPCSGSDFDSVWWWHDRMRKPLRLKKTPLITHSLWNPSQGSRAFVNVQRTVL